jgi:WD40 repeat protein
MEEPDYKFDVFLSYSRKDEEFGRRLEEALENYTLPKDVNTRSIFRKRLNVFRDKKDLVPNMADYYEAIEGYLKQSRYLVVVCSPNARSSPYVNAEIETYLRSNEANRVIPVLLSGKPNNVSEAKPEEYAFPQALCDALAMPLAVEFTEFERAPGKLNKGRYHDSWYTLLSKIFGTERAEIERLDAKRQARRRAIFAGVSLAVIAALSVALVFVMISRQQAASERDHAQQLLYASDINLAQRAFESGNVGLGRDLLEAHRPKSGERDLRGFEWYYLWQLYNGQLASFKSTEDLAFSRDGSRFATVTGDAIKVWDTASQRESANIALGPVPNNSKRKAIFTPTIDFSPDGNTVAYGDNLRGTLLFDLGSASSRRVPIPTLDEKQKQSSVLSSEDGIKRYWEEMVGGGAPRFSPDGRLLAVAYSCGVVAVYDAKSLNQIATLGDGPGVQDCASFVTFSPDGKLLAYGNSFNVNLWDTVTYNNLPEPEQDVSQPDSIDELVSVAFSPDSRILAIGDRSKQVVLWNISTRKVLARLKGHEGWVSALAFSPDGKTLYSGGIDKTVKVWDFSSYNGDGRVNAENIKPFANLKGHTDSIVSIRSAPNGKIIATVGTDETANLWADTAGQEFEKIDEVHWVFPAANLAVRMTREETNNTTTFFEFNSEIRAKPASTSSVPDIVSPDGRIVGFENHRYDAEPQEVTIDLREAGSLQNLTSLPAHRFRSFATFSEDNRIFCVIGRDGKSVMLWDTVEKKELPAIKNDADLQSYLISADGKVIVTFDKNGSKIKTWEIASQHELAQLVRQPTAENNEEETPFHTDPHTLSADGQLLAFSDSTKVELWQVKSADAPLALANQEMRGPVSVIAFSPDGKILAAGDDFGTVRIWDTVTRQELATFMGHKDSVTTLAFSPDSRTLASGGGGRDGAVKLYGLSALREMLTLTHEPSPSAEVHAGQGSEDEISKLFFSSDGRALITHSGNAILRIWRGNAPSS